MGVSKNILKASVQAPVVCYQLHYLSGRGKGEAASLDEALIFLSGVAYTKLVRTS